MEKWARIGLLTGARSWAAPIARSPRPFSLHVRDLRTLVVGSGHVGSWLAVTLARAGASVVLKHSARPLEHARAAVYQEAGVETTPVLQGEHAANLDLLFITTKTYGHASVASEIASSPVPVAPRIATILAHNGYMDYEAVHAPRAAHALTHTQMHAHTTYMHACMHKHARAHTQACVYASRSSVWVLKMHRPYTSRYGPRRCGRT